MVGQTSQKNGKGHGPFFNCGAEGDSRYPGVDSPFFSAIVLFKNQPFPGVFGGFLERTIPGKNGEVTPRGIPVFHRESDASGLGRHGFLTCVCRCPFWLIWSNNRGCLTDSERFTWWFNQLPGKSILFSTRKDTWFDMYAACHALPKGSEKRHFCRCFVSFRLD